MIKIAVIVNKAKYTLIIPVLYQTNSYTYFRMMV